MFDFKEEEPDLDLEVSWDQFFDSGLEIVREKVEPDMDSFRSRVQKRTRTHLLSGA